MRGASNGVRRAPCLRLQIATSTRKTRITLTRFSVPLIPNTDLAPGEPEVRGQTRRAFATPQHCRCATLLTGVPAGPDATPATLRTITGALWQSRFQVFNQRGQPLSPTRPF